MIIVPNRYDPISEGNGEPELRFAEFLEDITNAVNDLIAIPVNTQEADYTFVLEDAGTIIRKTVVTSQQKYTVPASTAVAYEVGTRIEVQNDTTSSLSLTIDDDTLTSEAGLGTGTRTIGPKGSAKLTLVEETQWKIRGEQLT